MSWWKYVLKTDWRQKKADWAEFQTLRQNSKVAYNAMLAARARISRDYNKKKDCHTCACINYVHADRTLMDIDYCPQFYLCDNMNGCYRLHCEYVDKNHEYHAKRKNYYDLCHAVRFFWTRKFAHVK